LFSAAISKPKEHKNSFASGLSPIPSAEGAHSAFPDPYLDLVEREAGDENGRKEKGNRPIYPAMREPRAFPHTLTGYGGEGRG